MNRMANRIFKFLENRKGMSFVDLENQIEGFKGDLLLELNPNVILWQGVSEPAREAMNILLSVKKIEMIPTPLLVYLIDGRALRLPIAKSAASIKKGYKKPHWLPVVFSGVK